MEHTNKLLPCLSCRSNTTRRVDGRPECYQCEGSTATMEDQLKRAREKYLEAQSRLNVRSDLTMERPSDGSPHGVVAELCCFACEESRWVRSRCQVVELESWILEHAHCESDRWVEYPEDDWRLDR